ncbi:hypothetical protein [Aureivirga marina]|uniref:hypothetical protein n=1 Tax=Aureivirga marina TaxID=1182451 RepID=UPI0018CA0214|nr:hypothetical protein [Aureivirga marina]
MKMKKYLLFFLVFSMISCGSIKVDLAEMQQIFPGIESISPYKRIEIDITTKKEIEIDSIYVNLAGMCGKLEFNLKQEKTILNTTKIQAGNYKIVSGNLENNVINKNIVSCVLKEGTAKIFYRNKGVSKTKSVSSFSNVRKYSR